MQRPILIVGAGLCGLVTALALRKLGKRVLIAEQASALGEIGAGLTLSRGVMRCLHWLGLLEAVTKHSEPSVSLPFLHYQTGQLLRPAMQPRSGADGIFNARQIHRADLHAILVDAVHAHGDRILLNHKLTGLIQRGDSVRARFNNDTVIETPLLIGSDGVRSIVRQHVQPGDSKPSFSGHVAFRCLVPAELAQPYMSAGRGAVYVGPGRTINRYALRHGRIVNCVGLANTSDWREEGWSTPASNAEFLSHFAHWHRDVTGLIAAAPPSGIIKWALLEHEPRRGWSKDRVVLAGDAAHPTLPFLGLGAAMAIEDGVILAQTLAAYENHSQALTSYESIRLPRTHSIFIQSRRQGALLQSMHPDSYSTADAPAHDPALFDFDPLLAAHEPFTISRDL